MRPGGLLVSVVFASWASWLAAASPALAEGEETEPPEIEIEDEPTGPTTFEQIAAKARPVDRASLGSMLWSMSASCEDGDALDRRQCRVIRDARARAARRDTLLVVADQTAFTAGPWNTRRKSLALTVGGCVACVEPVAVEDRAYYVVSGREPVSFEGALARSPKIYTTNRAFRSQERAEAWQKEVVPRLRTELVVSLGDEPWQIGGKRGLYVEVLAWRVSDPCDGTVVTVSPHGDKRVEADQAACGETLIEGKSTKKGDIADRLTKDMITEGMQPMYDSIAGCKKQHGMAGRGKLHVVVAADGGVITATIDGDFEETPTGGCLVKAAKKLRFPRTTRTRQAFAVPIQIK